MVARERVSSQGTCAHAHLLIFVLLCLLSPYACCVGGDHEGRHVWAVKVEGGRSEGELQQLADSAAANLGLENRGKVEPFRNIFEFELPLERFHSKLSELSHERGMVDVQAAFAHYDRSLWEHPSVVWVSKQRPLRRTKRGVGFQDPMFPRQWHLVNHKEVGHDINVTGVWEMNITGRGVVIAVLDDGLEHKNVDLAANYNSTGSYDFNSGDSDPSPHLGVPSNSHGTKCAGLIAAVANNGVCGVGVAYEAQVAGIRMLDGTVTDILEGRSFLYQPHINWIISCSWGPDDDGITVEGPGRVAMEALELAISEGRYGYGNIFVFASGNGWAAGDNCNYDGYANSIYTVTIGAVNEEDKMPYYAELCPVMFGVTYSNGQGERGIVTTAPTKNGGCTQRFSGTSAAAPIASGMIALMLEVRYCLTWRDVQSLLVYSSVKVDVGKGGWEKNAAGFHHSDQHGFGLLDAFRMTRAAGVWPLLPPMRQWSSGFQQTNLPITAGPAPLSVTVNVSAAELPSGLNTLEHVAVTVSLEHSCRGSLEIALSSPHNTGCTLATKRRRDASSGGLDRWTFTTVKFWGESPNGTWTLTILQHSEVCVTTMGRAHGTLTEWQLTLYGSELSSEDIEERKRLIDDAIASNTSEWHPLSCPPLPPHPHTLNLPDFNSHSRLTWERVVILVVLVVAVSVVVVGLEWVCRRGRERGRRPLLTRLFSHCRKQTTDTEEMTLLLEGESVPVGGEEGEGEGGARQLEQVVLLVPPGNSGGDPTPLDSGSSSHRDPHRSPSPTHDERTNTSTEHMATHASTEDMATHTSTDDLFISEPPLATVTRADHLPTGHRETRSDGSVAQSSRRDFSDSVLDITSEGTRSEFGNGLSNGLVNAVDNRLTERHSS